jgi:hypothetical protein
MRFTSVERYRAPHPLGFQHSKGDDFGWFEIERVGQPKLYVMAAPSSEIWEHVSVSSKNKCPSWEDMCFVKS